MIQHLDWWMFVGLLPIVYWLIPVRFRPALLVLSSLAVLTMLAPFDVMMMLAVGLLVYGSFTVTAMSAAAVAGGGQTNMVIGGLANLGRSPLPIVAVILYLFWYKYIPGIVRPIDENAYLANLVVPIGISYFSFKLIHYAIERRRNMLPEHNIQDFLSWLFLMPTFTSGPIERFEHFLDNREEKFRTEFLVEGGTRIAQGLIKKFVIVDALSRVSHMLSGGDVVAFADGSGGHSAVWAVWAYLAIDLLISYLDFSAYTDIAIGASRLFGFRIMENFNYPLLAANLVEFWRRWHMTLTAWCRAYVYMPMIGLTRNPYLAVIATFVVVGLWHAGSINWLVWGLWHGVGQAVVQRWARFAQQRKINFFKTQTGRFIGWAVTMAYVMLGGSLEAFDHSGGFLDALKLMGRALGIQ